MHKTLTLAACAFALSLSASRAAELIPFPPVPGGTATRINGINDNFRVTGSYTLSNGKIWGYVYEGDFGSAGSYDIFAYTVDADETWPRAISNNNYVSGYSPAPQDGLVFGYQFLMQDGIGDIITIKSKKNNHGVPLDGLPQAIDSDLDFVGDYWHAVDGNLVASGYRGEGSTYRADIVLPFNTDRTHPRGHNSRGVVVGYFTDNDMGGKNRGFVLDRGVATAVDYPDPSAFYVFLESINDHGTIAGFWEDQAQTRTHAFLLDVKKERFMPIKVRGAAFAQANAITSGDVVALDTDRGPFVYCRKPNNSCPAVGTRALHVADREVSAARSLHPHPCKDDCLSPALPSAAPLSAAQRDQARRETQQRTKTGYVIRP